MDGPRAPRRAASAALPVLAFALAWPISAWPQEQPASPAPAPVVAPPAEPPPPEAAPPAWTPPPDEWTWIDTSHRFLSRAFLWAVLRFDRFFADERDLDLPRTRSFVRWRNALVLREGGRHSYVPDFRAEVVLPSLDRRLDQLRLRLTVATTSREAIDPLLPPVLRPLDVPSRPHAALVLSPFSSARARADLQTGALLGRPLGWFGRARVRGVQPIGELLVARVALAGFWQTDIGLGTRQAFSLEHPLSPWLLLRLDNGSMVAERSRGWEWSSELALLAAAWPRTALSLSTAAFGASQAGHGVEVWRVQARARHDVFRRWIFLEVVPETAWTRTVGGHLHRQRAITLRLELQFDASSGATIGWASSPVAGEER